MPQEEASKRRKTTTTEAYSVPVNNDGDKTIAEKKDNACDNKKNVGDNEQEEKIEDKFNEIPSSRTFLTTISADGCSIDVSIKIIR